MRRGSALGITSITLVRNNQLIGVQPALQSNSEDIDVWPATTHERSIDPADITSLNTDTHLVTDSSRLELVRVPAPVDWKSINLVHFAIRSIDRKLAGLVTTAAENSKVESVLQLDL